MRPKTKQSVHDRIGAAGAKPAKAQPKAATMDAAFQRRKPHMIDLNGTQDRWFRVKGQRGAADKGGEANASMAGIVMAIRLWILGMLLAPLVPALAYLGLDRAMRGFYERRRSGAPNR